ncbi:MAG: FHA domain-containing serine/threonine-protein kinase, partial [Planctomycetota bacterium]
MSEGPGSGGLRLVLLGEEGLWAELPMSETLVVGSAAERAGFVVRGQGVDPAHCAIGRTKGGGWAIKDLGSQYGTIVNGERVSTARLWTGDLIVLGSRRLRIVDPELPLAGETAAGAIPAAPLEEIAEPTLAGGPAGEPRRLAGFRLDTLIGRGATGAVFLALQESLHRPVALKILSPRLAADRDFVRRFQTEARAAAALNHPNVVVVYDVGEEAGQHYLAMEFMPGGTLEDRLASAGPLPWREVLDVLRDAAAGLVYAEERGIVHRDIKPANLMLTGTGTVKIADLGLATTVEAEATQSEGKKIFGTPHFISPEQARGEAVDHRSDLYSLGATVYRLLTAHTPFEGETTRDILRGHFTATPRPPSALVPGLPPALDALVRRLLEKDPADRPPSAALLLREVERLRVEADEGIAAPPARARRRFPVRGVVTLLLLAAAGGVLWRFRPILSVPRGAPPSQPGVPPGPAIPDDTEFFGGGEPGAGTGEAAETDEERLQILELQAELAYRDLPGPLSPAARIQRLRAIAAEFPATRTAERAAVEIQDLEAAAARAAREAAEREAALAAVGGALRAAAAWPPPAGELPRPGAALAALGAYEPAAPLAGDPAFRSQVDALAAEIVAASTAAVRAALEQGDALAAAGDFTGLGALLDDLAGRLELPAAPPEGEPPDRAELRRLAGAVSARRAGLAGEQAAWAAA